MTEKDREKDAGEEDKEKEDKGKQKMMFFFIKNTNKLYDIQYLLSCT